MYYFVCHVLLFLVVICNAISSTNHDVPNAFIELDTDGNIKPEYLKDFYANIPRHRYGFLSGVCYAPNPAGGEPCGPPHGYRRCLLVPKDDYVEDIDKFLELKDGHSVLKKLLGNKEVPLDDLKALKIYKVPNGTMLEYVTGYEHTSVSDSTLFVLVNNIRRWHNKLYCSYDIICRDYDELYCRKCDTEVPEKGRVKLWYSGQQASVKGKKYNIYTIFGQKVLNVAGGLIIPYDISSDDTYTIMDANCSNTCITM